MLRVLWLWLLTRRWNALGLVRLPALVPELVRRFSDSSIFGRSSSLSRRPIAMTVRRRRELERLPHRLKSMVSQQCPNKQGTMNARDMVGRRCPASLSSCVPKPPSLVSPCCCSIVGSPQHASPGRQTGAAAEACRRNRRSLAMSRMAMRLKIPIGLWGGFLTKSDTLSRLSLIKAFGGLAGFWGTSLAQVRSTRHRYIQAWWRINGAPELRAHKQGFDKSSRTTRKIGCRDKSAERRQTPRKIS